MKRLLIVDDSPASRQLLRHIFTSAGGYVVVAEAASGAEAVRLFRQKRPDVVTMDIVMPGMDGIEAVRQILALDPAARVVMVSGHGQEGLVMESLVAGAKDFIDKPFDPETVLRAIERVVDSG